MRRTPVVVTGIGVICPLGRDKDEFWTNLVAGRSGVRPATDRDFEGMTGVFLGEVEDEWVTSQLPAGADGSVRMNALALVAAEQALRGRPLDASSIAAAAEQAAEGTEPPADLNASAEYKRHLARVLTRRALETAASS
jgi:3-oxoacyl-(acyl-carrier-protein) synthase